MLVFEATDQLQGQRPTDHHHASTRELVYLPFQECKTPGCGCTRGFAGLTSRQATTTAIVVERPDLPIEALSQLVATSLHEGGWLDSADPGSEVVSGLATEIVELASSYGHFGPGAVIEREGNDLTHRLDVPAA